MLTHEKKNKKIWRTEKGTVDRIFEIYEESSKNESGEKPVFVRPEVIQTKKKML